MNEMEMFNLLLSHTIFLKNPAEESYECGPSSVGTDLQFKQLKNVAEIHQCFPPFAIISPK